MKTKGITIWEKHAEKIVLGMAFVAAGALTAMQFIGEPNAVSTNAGDVAPSEIDGLLQARAEDLLAKLRDDAPAGVVLPFPKLGFDDLLAQRNLSLSPGPVLPPFQIALAPSVVGVGLGKNLDLHVPRLKAPDQVAVGQYVDALVDGIVERFPELQEYFEPDGPHDLIFATVRARFDLADLREQFRGKDGDADAATIPSSWYNNRPEHLVDVIVEREELQDGHWTDLRTIDPIPGQTSVREDIAGDLYVEVRDDVLGRLSGPEFQLAVIQPPFYPTKGEDWSIPQWSDGDAADDREAMIKKFRRNLQLFYADRDHLVGELEDAGGSVDDDKEDDRRGGRDSGKRAPPGSGKRAPPGSGGSGFGGQPGGDTGKRGDRDDTPAKDNQRRQKKLKRQIMRVDVRIRSTRTDLRELGIDPDAVEIVADPFAALDGDEILVWGHDITVKPGRTYRYRVTVSVYNPFFGKKRSLVQDQQSLAEDFTLNSEPSDWAPPVHIHPLQRVFITSAASGGGQHGFGRATAEVYIFHDGTQWVEKFFVRPGMAIGGVKKVKRADDDQDIEIDFTTSLFVLDIVEEVASRDARGRRDLIRGQSRVLLRDLDDPKIMEMRDPRIEESDPERQRLRDKLPPTERPA